MSGMLVTHHASIRYLERKCGYPTKEITAELIAKAKSELAEYFKGAIRMEWPSWSGVVYRNAPYQIDFFTKGHAIVTVIPTGWRLEKKKKDGYRNRALVRV